MELKLSKEAMKDIQADVDALTRSEKYFQVKLERVDMYMPIIERVFAEEGLPDDFKYLVIQESALISDAVSSSNAVGFWQFKEISALENDLRIDRYVDERMNIVSATRAAATYLKNHNKNFDNWAYSLIAYQRGVVGALDVIDKRYYGASKMPITKNTYWYLKKYLAHKIAFENALGSTNPSYFLLEDENIGNMTITEISRKHNVDESLVEEYNKWLKRGRVPTDKNYTAIIPLEERPNLTPYSNKRSPLSESPQFDDSSYENQAIIIEGPKPKKNVSIAHKIKVNGLDAIVAAKDFTVGSLAEKAGLSEKKFRRFNDMSMNQKLVEGEIYYTERKLNRAKYYYHTVYPGETMWEISQRYGLKLHKLYRKNRMKDPASPKAGRVLWLRLNRPSSVGVEYKKIQQKSINKEQAQKSLNKVKEQIPLDSAKIDEAKNKENEIDSAASNREPKMIADSIVSEREPNTVIVNEADSTMENDEVINSIQQTKEPETVVEEEDDNENKSLQLKEYTIKRGDTFFSIANRFNMKISDLLSINNLSIKEPLAIGQVIMVSNVNSETTKELYEENTSNNLSESTKTHKIEAGETLYGIARNYEVSIDDLMKWNNKKDYAIKEGEIIIIKLK